MFLPVRQQQTDNQRLACALYVPWVFLTLVRQINSTSSESNTNFRDRNALIQEPIDIFLRWIQEVCNSYPTYSTSITFPLPIALDATVSFEESELSSGDWHDESAERPGTSDEENEDNSIEYDYGSDN